MPEILSKMLKTALSSLFVSRSPLFRLMCLLAAKLRIVLAQSCVTPLPAYTQAKGLRMIVLVAILDSIAKGSSCFHYFLHGASLHRS